jgi:hypothetical protein
MQRSTSSGSEEVWTSGMWAGEGWVVDYRAEWLGEMLIERATVSTDSGAHPALDSWYGSDWARPGTDVVRFWLLAENQVIDKVVGVRGAALGYFMPVTTPLERTGERVAARALYLGMQVDSEWRITVTGEKDFDSAVARGDLTPVEIEHAECRIREMTAAAAARLLPTAFVRNFAILKDVPP